MFPFFTLVLPCYNRSDELFIRMLDSILKQEFTDFELLIIDNASDKIDIPTILKDYKDDRIQYYRQSQLVRMGENWGTGVRKAKGQWVSIVHDDDYMYPTHLLENYNLIMANPDSVFVHTTPEVYFKENGIKKYNLYDLPFKENINFDGIELIKACIQYSYIFTCAPAVMVKREIYVSSLPFSSFPVLTTDINMWFKILFKKNVKAIYKKSYTYQYVMHTNQLTTSFRFGQLQMHFELIQYVFKLPPNYWMYWLKHFFNGVILSGFKNMIRRLR